jgi:hypothetical protein
VLALVSLLWMGTPASSTLPLRGVLVADPFATLWKAMLLVFTLGVCFLLARRPPPTTCPRGMARSFSRSWSAQPSA